MIASRFRLSWPPFWSRICLSSASLCLALFFPFQGEARAASSDFRGTIQAKTAVETEDGDIQTAAITFTPEWTRALGGWGELTIIGRIRSDLSDDLEPGRPPGRGGARSPASGKLFIGDRSEAELREAYVDIYKGDAFFRLGKQQVVWGQADGLRVLDAVNPLEYREFILPDFEDRRIALWMVNAEWIVGGVTAQFLWIPDHSYDVVPPEGTYAITSPRLIPQPPAGFDGSIRVMPAERPDALFTDDDYGFRLTGFSGGWDWSLNYLYSHCDTPVFRSYRLSEGTVEVKPSYERTHLVGGSASNAFGDFTVRTEIGVRTDSYTLTGAQGDDGGVFDSPDISYVIGLDYQADADTLVSGQLFQSYLPDHDPLAVRDKVDTTVSLLARREFRNDTLKAEMLTLHSVSDGDGLVQLSLDYNMTSSTILTIGADIFHGPSKGLYGQFDDADRFYAGVEVGF